MSSATSSDATEAYGPEERPLPQARVRDLKLLIKDWRRGRATKSLWEAFHDAYIVVIAALMIGAMLINVVLKAQTTVSQCSSDSCLSARTVLPWAALPWPWRSAWPPAGCSARCWRRPPRASVAGRADQPHPAARPATDCRRPARPPRRAAFIGALCPR